MKPLRVALLMGLAMTPPPCVGSAVGQDAPAPPTAGRPSLPVRIEHRYRMLARVRPMLFWLTRDNVGGARLTWREGRDESVALELLIGSDPERAPRHVNRWGYIAEESRAAESRVIGVMKESNEQSIREAESSVTGDTRTGGHIFNVIQATVSGSDSRAQLASLRAAGNPSYRDLETLLAGAGATSMSTPQKIVLPPGTRPGFLSALAALMRDHAGPDSGRTTSAMTYVHFRTLYDMTVRSSERLAVATIDGHRYTNLVRASFEVRNRTSGETTRFKLTYGTEGALAGVPVQATYQPRWWFEVQLFLDDTTRF